MSKLPVTHRQKKLTLCTGDNCGHKLEITRLSKNPRYRSSRGRELISRNNVQCTANTAVGLSKIICEENYRLLLTNKTSYIIILLRLLDGSKLWVIITVSTAGSGEILDHHGIHTLCLKACTYLY